jgi:ATP-dependent DNA ligase
VLADRVACGSLGTALHEIKHDGWRMIARREGDRVRLWSRNGRDWTNSFAVVRSALMALPVTSVCLDGEVVAHCVDGLPDFFALRSDATRTYAACLYAFDLLMLNGDDTRGLPLIERKARLADILTEATPGIIWISDGRVSTRRARFLCAWRHGRTAHPIEYRVADCTANG